MKRLKLQMQMTVDGYVAGPGGRLDWMEFNWSDDIKNYVNDLTDSVDTILLGRKMTEGFISYWSDIKPESEEYAFARKMMDKPKFVFTKTLQESKWENTSLAKENIQDAVNSLKDHEGKDIIVYGGAGFVSSLIQNNLIDEYYFFINPVVLGNGMTIFHKLPKTDMVLLDSIKFDCGIVLNRYEQRTRS